MITYALVDPRNLVPRYIGRTINPKARLQCHISERIENDTFWPELSSRSIWVGRLRDAGLRPIMVVLAKGDFERVYYEAFHRAGIKMTNAQVPPRRLLLTYIKEKQA